MRDLFLKNNRILNEQNVFCIKRIYEIHSSFILDDANLFIFLISTMTELLK